MSNAKTVQQSQDADAIHESNNQVNPAATPEEVKASEVQEAEQKEAQKADENTPVEPTEGDSPEEAAARRAGVSEENLGNPKQNREPRTKFERENQKNTEAKRKVAHRESNLTSRQREEQAQSPADMAQEDAARTLKVNQGINK